MLVGGVPCFHMLWCEASVRAWIVAVKNEILSQAPCFDYLDVFGFMSLFEEVAREDGCTYKFNVTCRRLMSQQRVCVRPEEARVNRVFEQLAPL